GKIASLEYPEYPLPDYDLFAAGAQVTCGWDGPEDAAALTCRWMKRVLQYNRVIDAEEGDGSWVKLEASPTFSIAPGLHYVIGIQAFTTYDADAIMDPVLELLPRRAGHGARQRPDVRQGEICRRLS